MNVYGLIERASMRGVALECCHGQLVARPKGVLTEGLRSELVAHKAEILEALQEAERIAGSEWTALSGPERAALLRSIEIRRMRERGEVPAHYTATTTCAHCGPVPIFPGCPLRVQGCPWCLNRRVGLPVPIVDALVRNSAR